VSEARVREAVIDKSFSRRSTFLQLRRALLRPRIGIWLAITVVACAAFAIIDVTSAIALLTAILALILVVLGLSTVLGIRAIDRVLPAGSTISVTLTENTIVVRTAKSSSETPYSSLLSAVRSGEFVVVQYRVSRLVVAVYPGSMFTDDDLDLLNAAIAGGDAQQQLPIAATAAFSIDHWFTTDAEFTARAANALTLQLALRPGRIAFYVFFFICGGLLLLLALVEVASSDLYDNDIVSAVIVNLVFGTLVTVLPPGLIALSRVIIGRQLRRVIPVGSRYGFALGEEKFTVQAPANSGQMEYSLFRRVRRRGDFVFLVPKFGYRLIMLPAQLLPAGELESLTKKIEAR
jgi:hypothetical protein